MRNIFPPKCTKDKQFAVPITTLGAAAYPLLLWLMKAMTSFWVHEDAQGITEALARFKKYQMLNIWLAKLVACKWVLSRPEELKVTCDFQ